MIQKISTAKAPAFASVHKNEKSAAPSENGSALKDKVKTALYRTECYADCFVNNAKKSAPVFLGLTFLWSGLEKKYSDAPVKKTLGYNLKNYFVPVLAISSLALTIIENPKTKSSKK